MKNFYPLIWIFNLITFNIGLHAQDAKQELLVRLDSLIAEENDVDAYKLSSQHLEEYFQDYKNKESTKSTENYLRLINSLIYTGEYLGHHKICDSLSPIALDIFESEYGTDNLHYALAIDNMGWIEFRKEEMAKAEEYWTRVLQLRKKFLTPEDEEIGTTINNIGTTHLERNQYDIALKRYEEAYEHRKKYLGPDHDHLNNSLMNIGNTWFAMGDYRKTREYFTRAYEARKNSLGANHPKLANIIGNLALLNSYLAEHEKAIEYELVSADIRKKTFGNNHLELAYSYSNLAYFYIQQRLSDDAEYYNNLALEIRKKKLPRKNPLIALNYIYKGIIHQYREEYELSEDAYHIALELNNEGKDDRHYANTLYNRGLLYLDKDQYEKAVIDFDSSLVYSRQLLDFHHSDIAQKHFSLAKAYFYLNDESKAQKNIQLALFSLFPEYNHTDFLNSPTNTDFNLSEMLGIKYLLFKAFMIYSSDNNIANITTARECIHVALNITMKSKQLLTRKSDKLTFVQTVKDLVVMGIKIELLESEPNYDKISELMNFNRSLVLDDYLKLGKIKSAHTVPDSLIKLDEELYSFKNYINRQLITVKDSLQEQKLKGQLTNLNERIDSIQNVYTTVYGITNDDSYQYSPLDMVADEAIVSYVADVDTVYTLACTQDSWTFDSTVISNLQDNVMSYVKDLSDPSSSIQMIQEKGSSLYVSLIPDDFSVNQYRQLHVFPDDILSILPFETFRIQNQYLIETTAINYPSHQKDLLPSSRVNQKLSYAAFAPSYSDTITSTARTIHNRDFGPLQYNIDEIDLLQPLYNGDYYKGKDASISNFKKSTRNTHHLHLAMHGIVDYDNSENSYLAFVNSEGKVDRLHSFEIADLDLTKVNNVVLSACDSGQGEFASGDGVQSISFAFKYAGVKNIISSLWLVNDLGSLRFMEQFYENYAKNSDLIQSLAQAKVSMINRKDRMSHPFYWAGFIVSGQASPKQNSAKFFYFIAAGLIGLLGFFLLKKYVA